jgi:hypothetical protein
VCRPFEGQQVSPELLRAQIEVGTRVCANISEAGESLRVLRRAVIDVAESHGLAPIAASTHPFAHWTEQKHTERARYASLYQEMQTAARRLLICGMHVHVGIDDVIEHDQRFLNRHPKGEPQLGRRGLYRKLGGERLPERELAMLWLLNQSDGTQSLLDVAERATLPFNLIRNTCAELVEAGLLEPVKDNAGTQ